MDELKLKIRKFIENNLIVFEEEAKFTDEDNIFELGFVNSLFAMRLLNFIENEFHITINNEDIELLNFNSVNNIFNLLSKKYSVLNQ